MEGYLYSAIARQSADSVFFHTGQNYDLKTLTVSVYNPFEAEYTKERVSGNFRQYVSRKIKSYADNGYPFVSLQNDSIEIVDTGYSLHATLFPGPYIAFDSLVLSDPSVYSRSYLRVVMDMPKGGPYNESSYQKAAAKLSQLPAAELNGPLDVSFVNGKATVYVDLKPTRQNSFEGVVGLLPRQSAGESLGITGFLDLQLGNLFKSGKSLGFSWNRFADQSQNLELGYDHPFLFQSPVTVGVDFLLLKQDTTFLNQNWQVEADVGLGLQRLYVDFTRTAGSLIKPDASAVRQGFADFNRKLYGFRLQSLSYDQPFNLFSRWGYQVGLAVGSKNIEVNPALDEEVYEGIDLKTSHFQAIFGFKYQLRSRRTALVHDIAGRWMQTSQLLTNEMFRIGGLRSLRGFNEKFYFAEAYVLSRMEIRQYFENESYFMAFYDQALLDQKERLSFPRGVGVGLTLDTSSGLFTFAMAVGMAKNVPIDPSSVKVHIGYISKF